MRDGPTMSPSECNWRNYVMPTPTIPLKRQETTLIYVHVGAHKYQGKGSHAQPQVRTELGPGSVRSENGPYSI